MQKIINWIKKNIHLSLLFLICIIILTSHTFYVLKTGQYPKMDEHSYMEIGTAFYRILQNPGFDAPSRIMQYIIDHPPFRQPLYPLILSVVFLPFGLSEAYKIALWLNGLFFITSIVSIYFLAKEFISKTSSLMASFIFATYGFPLFYLHFTYSETATTAFITLTLAFLVRSKHFLSRKDTIFLAAGLFLSLMTRWIAVIFLVAPIAISIIQTTIQKKKIGIRIRNISLIALILLPAIIFYVSNQAYLRDYVGSNISNGPGWVVEYVNNPYLKNKYSLQSIAYYFKVFEQNTIFFFSLFLIGLFISVIKGKKYYFLLLAFFIPYAFLTFGATLKDDRYIVPIYPIIAIISVLIFEYIKNIKLKALIIVLTVVLGLGNFIGASWAKGPLGDEGLKSILVSMPIGHPRYVHFTTLVWPPPRDVTGAKEIVGAIESDWEKNNSPIIYSLYNVAEINNAIYTRTNYLKETPYAFSTLEGFPQEKRYIYFFDALRNADYLLVKSNVVLDGSQPEENVLIIKQANEAFKKRSLPNEYILLKTVQIPFDRSEIFIYKKTKIVSDKSLMDFVNLMLMPNPENTIEITTSVELYLEKGLK